MSKTVENTNLKKSNLKEFFKNFLSIFADEKKSDEDLETLIYDSDEITAKTARILAKSESDIASGKFENIKITTTGKGKGTPNVGNSKKQDEQKDQDLESLIESKYEQIKDDDDLSL